MTISLQRRGLRTVTNVTNYVTHRMPSDNIIVLRRRCFYFGRKIKAHRHVLMRVVAFPA